MPGKVCREITYPLWISNIYVNKRGPGQSDIPRKRRTQVQAPYIFGTGIGFFIYIIYIFNIVNWEYNVYFPGEQSY